MVFLRHIFSRARFQKYLVILIVLYNISQEIFLFFCERKKENNFDHVFQIRQTHKDQQKLWEEQQKPLKNWS